MHQGGEKERGFKNSNQGSTIKATIPCKQEQRAALQRNLTKPTGSTTPASSTGYHGYLCLVEIPSTSQRKEKWLGDGQHKHPGSQHDITPRPQPTPGAQKQVQIHRHRRANPTVPDSRARSQMPLDKGLGARLLLGGRILHRMPKTSSAIPSNAETKQKTESKCFSDFNG